MLPVESVERQGSKRSSYEFWKQMPRTETQLTLRVVALFPHSLKAVSRAVPYSHGAILKQSILEIACSVASTLYRIYRLPHFQSRWSARLDETMPQKDATESPEFLLYDLLQNDINSVMRILQRATTNWNWSFIQGTYDTLLVWPVSVWMHLPHGNVRLKA